MAQTKTADVQVPLVCLIFAVHCFIVTNTELDISEVERQILAVEADIKVAIANIILPPNHLPVQYWVDEKTALRAEKATLRAKEATLRAEKAALRVEKAAHKTEKLELLKYSRPTLNDVHYGISFFHDLILDFDIVCLNMNILMCDLEEGFAQGLVAATDHESSFKDRTGSNCTYVMTYDEIR